jgi:hypothetical protein
MADQKIGDLINRISEDLNDIEEAQTLIRKAGQETERIQEAASGLMSSSERHITQIKEQFDKKLVPRITEIIQQLSSLNSQNKNLFEQIKDLNFDFLKNEIKSAKNSLSTKIDEGLSGLSDQQRNRISNLDSSISALEKSISSVSQSLEAISIELRKSHSQTQNQLTRVDAEIEKTVKNVNEASHFNKYEFSILKQKQEDTTNQIESIIQEFNRHRNTQKLWLVLLSVGVVLILLLQISTYFFPPTALSSLDKNQSQNEQQSSTHQQKPEQIIADEPATEYEEPQLVNEVDAPINLLTPEEAQSKLGKRAEYAMTYLKEKKIDKLTSKYFHPEHGVRFLPFGLASDGTQLLPKEIKQKWDSKEIINWGKTLDGSPLILSMQSYYNDYIYSQDYQNLKPTYNELDFEASSGINLQKLSAEFVDGVFVEYHHEESALILVFQDVEDGYPCISGIIYVEM